jgi:hypothetical protein
LKGLAALLGHVKGGTPEVVALVDEVLGHTNRFFRVAG